MEEVQTLKDLTCDAPVVGYPQFGTGATFVLETDASVQGLGAILAQLQPDGTVHTLPMLLAPCGQLRLTMAYLS